jgi:hypothetical protein
MQAPIPWFGVPVQSDYLCRTLPLWAITQVDLSQAFMNVVGKRAVETWMSKPPISLEEGFGTDPNDQV